MVDHLKKLTEDYIDKTDDLLASRKLGEGFFGMPDSAKSHPCHTEYFNAVENTVKEYIAGEPDAETAEAAVRFLLTASDEYPCSNLASWMLVAIQNHALPLIPYLSKDVKAELYTWFSKHVPRLQRLPVQREIIKALKR